MKYRRKAVYAQAYQPSSGKPVPVWLQRRVSVWQHARVGETFIRDGQWHVVTPQRPIPLPDGGWIILTDNQLLPCTDESFRELFEEADGG